jgi:hypothetical protein
MKNLNLGRYKITLFSYCIFLLCVFSGNTANADGIDDQENLSLWLQKTSQQNTKSESTPVTFVYKKDEFYTHFNSPESSLSLPEVGINEYGYNESKMKTTKSNERKLLRKLSDKLKVNIFNHNGRKQNQNVYFNTVKNELVGKMNFGKARYELRVADDQSEAHFRYDF